MKKIFCMLFLLLIAMTFAVQAEEALEQPIVFTFNSDADIKQNILSSNALNVELSDGYAKLSNTTNDPNFCLPVDDLGIDTAVYKYIKIHFRCADGLGKNLMCQVFFATDKNGEMASPSNYINYTFVPKDGFIDVMINLSDLSGYRGTLKTLRYDPYVGNDELPKTDIFLDYIALFSNQKQCEKYPEALSDDEVGEINDAIEAAKIAVTRTEKPDNMIYKFNSLTDFSEYATQTVQIDYEFTDGHIKITNLGTDPSITHNLTKDEYFYASDLPVFKVRFRPLVDLDKEVLAQFFFQTDSTVMGSDGTYKNIPFDCNGEWQEITLDLQNDIAGSKWDGIITDIRYDTVVAEKDEVIPIMLDYFGLFKNAQEAAAYTTESLLPPEGHDTFVLNYSNQRIILPAGTVKSGNTLNDFVLESETAENPDKVIGGPVVIYTSPDGQEQLVALSYGDVDQIYYVARNPGKYSLTYSTKKYDDISGHWGYAAIMFASNRQLFGGTSPTEFSPDEVMTRGMFITVLGRMHGIDTAQYTGASYSDVNPDEYYAPYIQWAMQNGIISEPQDSAFRPEEPVTRCEMAVMIAGYIEKYGYSFRSSDAVSEFTDISDLASDAQNAVKSVQSAGIINGKGDEIFDPNGLSTRAEVATVMSRLIKSILGIKLDFFETSEESMEFRPLSHDRLILGAYVPHGADPSNVNEQQIKDMADAGINFSILGYDNFNSIPRAKMENVFKWYERYGIEFVDADINVLKKASDGRTDIFDQQNDSNLFYADQISFAGVSLADEPGYKSFPEMGESVREFQALHPGKTAYINLLPMYANAAQLAEGAWVNEIKYYEDKSADYNYYLEEFVKNVPVDYICADVYPCYANKATYKSYAKSLEAIADACRKYGRDFWIVNQSCSWSSSIRVIDLEDMYWQTYTVLSFGAKAIIYYMFGHRGGNTGEPIDENGEKTDTYYVMKEVHDEIRRFEDVYLAYDNIGVMNHNSSPDKTPWLELNNPCTFDTISEIVCDKPLLIGCFEKKDKTSKAFTLVNYNDLASPASADVALKINGSKVTAYKDGYPNVITPDANGYFHITLESGRGIFVTVE